LQHSPLLLVHGSPFCFLFVHVCGGPVSTPESAGAPLLLEAPLSTSPELELDEVEDVDDVVPELELGSPLLLELEPPPSEVGAGTSSIPAIAAQALTTLATMTTETVRETATILDASSRNAGGVGVHCDPTVFWSYSRHGCAPHQVRKSNIVETSYSRYLAPCGGHRPHLPTHGVARACSEGMWTSRALRAFTLGSAAALVAGLVACSSDAIGTSEAEVGSAPTRAWTPEAKRAGNLRVATFNIRNFPETFAPAAADAGPTDEDDDAGTAEAPARKGPVRSLDRTDEAALVEVLVKLDFDVLAVQEIRDRDALRRVLERLGERTGTRYDAAFSDNAHSGNDQYVGLIVRADHARIEGAREHAEIDPRGTLRAGLSARVVSQKPGGADFGVLVLHLASGDSAKRAVLRAEQGFQASRVVAERQKEWADRDFVVLGDLNTARGDAELVGLDDALGGVAPPLAEDAGTRGDAPAATGLERQKNDSGCSSYYVKGSGSATVHPSLIDQVYLASMSERDTSVPLAAGAHCAERACAAFESDSAESGTTYWGVSDHCPVYFEVRDADDD
jgi:endonuclease/exonuclease/phosphatase family metal-dependent hydrolase